jgi:hypothetical protein
MRDGVVATPQYHTSACQRPLAPRSPRREHRRGCTDGGLLGAADSHYYRKLAADTPRYSGTTKKLKSAVVKSGAEGSMLDA